tara:strand:- start:39 stop:461 length:423 start_codon:yes stop_codon:yes gene_type:complete
MNNQQDKIITHFKHKTTLTNDEARSRYRVRSLTKVISNLRRQGFRIEGQWKRDKIDNTNYKVYHVYDTSDFYPTDNIKVKDCETGEILTWTLTQVLGEINRDRSEDWTDYNASDWCEGWYEWVDGNGYFKLVNLTEGETT